MKSSAYLRKHAELICETALHRNDDETDMALAYADRLLADAELADAIAGIDPATAPDAINEQTVPILGRITYRGGVIHSIEREWTYEHDESATTLGIMLAFQWCRSLHTPDAGRLQILYIGTRDHGPIAQWSAHDGYWRRLKSKGNFGKKWAYGGNWSDATFFSTTPPTGGIPQRNTYVFPDLKSCNPELNQTINHIMKTQEERIRIAKAKVEAAKLRQQSAQTRQYVAGYRRQGANPIYPQQSGICEGKAAVNEAFADQLDARAELILAEAGA